MNLDKLVENLNKFGYIVNVFDDVKQANEYLCKDINNTTVGIGGSISIDQMGLYDLLTKNNTVYWHWKNPEDIAKAATAEIYLSSVNGVSEDGEIINIDGTGNRVAATLYGHKKVIFILGINKIAENYEKALYRARNIAAVKNAERLNKKTPCVKTGKCMDCNSPDRICCGLSVLYRKPRHGEYEVVIIKEELGY